MAAVILRADKPPAAALGEFDTENLADRGSTPRTSTGPKGMLVDSRNAVFLPPRNLCKKYNSPLLSGKKMVGLLRKPWRSTSLAKVTHPMRHLTTLAKH